MAHSHEMVADYGLGVGDLKDLYNASVMTGTIIEIDYGADKADVEISGLGRKNNVSIFYHCGGSDTVEGGSTAFFEGDSVYVLNEKGSTIPSIFDLKIIGFVDKLKVCGFQFKITRGDGTIIDDSFNPGFTIMNSETDDVTGTISYESDPSSTLYQYWTLTLDTAFEHDPNGYWVWFEEVEDSIDTQYPLRYKYDDQEKTEDLIQPGRYEVEVPYWKLTYENNTPVYINWDAFRGLDCDEKMLEIANYPHFYTNPPGPDFGRYTTRTNFYKKITVKSSIPYKITEQLRPGGRHITSFGHDPEGVIGSFWGTKPCPELSALCISYGTTARFYGKELDITYTTINPPDSWDDVTEEYEEGPSIEGKTFEFKIDLTSDPDVTFYSYCWIGDNKYEHYATNISWYRFSTNRREISQFINISAIYDY